MEFNFTESQEMLRKMARDFLENECPKSMVRQMIDDEKGYSPELWQKMSGLGWLGLIMPVDYEGAGGTFMDLAVLLEEMGRALLPGPFLTAIVMSTPYIIEAANEKQKKEILPGISNGNKILAFALNEPGIDEYDVSSTTMKAEKSRGGYVINGTRLFVPYANVADYILCPVKIENGETDNRLTTFLINTQARGITCNKLSTMSGDSQFEVIFDNVAVIKDDIVGELGKALPQIEKMLQRATVTLCLEMLGGAQKVLEMTVEYSKVRVQFGRPIGSMQALQHHCANMVVSIEAARSLVYEAAWRISQGLPCAAEVSMAKSFASECYTMVTQLGMQVQGGVSFMEDHDLPLYYRKAKALEVMMGDPDAHREIVAGMLLE